MTETADDVKRTKTFGPLSQSVSRLEPLPPVGYFYAKEQAMKLSEPKRLYGKDLSQRLLKEQRDWIEQCEANGSYTGTNGRAILHADMAALRNLEATVRRDR